MTLDDVRARAHGLPEATEEPHHDRTSFRVRGKIFATALPGEGHVNVLVSDDEARAAVAEWPSWCEELWWGKKLSGVRVRLADADAAVVGELLSDAWRRKAPARLAASFDAR
jgi:hypothetical protein